MEVSALKLSGGVGLHGRSPLLRLQSDERLVALIRRGNVAAFEMLVARYESRLLAFCRHLLGSREDAEDVLQEVFSAAYKALLADEREINVRPWLYRIARNRSLNHLRRITAVGVDSMDHHLSDFGASTADQAHRREEFRALVADIRDLPETQRTALVLREMDALSYEQIAEAMETTVPSVKSLLVRARVGLAEAAEARMLTCDEVRDELGEVAEGLKRKPSPPVRRHLRTCARCEAFRLQLRETNKALAALLPLGPLVLLKKLALGQLGHHGGATAAGATAGSVAASTAFTGSGGLISAALGTVATKAAAGLAAAALVTAGAVAVDHSGSRRHTHAHHAHSATLALTPAGPSATATHAAATGTPSTATTGVGGGDGADKPASAQQPLAAGHHHHRRHHHHHHAAAKTKTTTTDTTRTATSPTTATDTTTTGTGTTTTGTTGTTTVGGTTTGHSTPPPPPPGRTETQTDPTVLPPRSTSSTPSTTAPPPASTAPMSPTG